MHIILSETRRRLSPFYPPPLYPYPREAYPPPSNLHSTWRQSLPLTAKWFAPYFISLGIGCPCSFQLDHCVYCLVARFNSYPLLYVPDGSGGRHYSCCGAQLWVSTWLRSDLRHWTTWAWTTLPLAAGKEVIFLWLFAPYLPRLCFLSFFQIATCSTTVKKKLTHTESTLKPFSTWIWHSPWCSRLSVCSRYLRLDLRLATVNQTPCHITQLCSACQCSSLGELTPWPMKTPDTLSA